MKAFLGSKSHGLEISAMKLYEMGFWLDSYDDLFSDFDPRSYSNKQLSDDFLFELKRRYRESPKGGLETKFYIPRKIRDGKIENSAKKKMRDYFSFELKRIEKRILQRRQTGIIYLAFGVLILTINGIFAWDYRDDRILQFLGFILAPAGWFSAWTSFEHFIIVPREDSEKREFFSRMVKCKFEFVDLENAHKEIGAASFEMKK